MRLALYIDGFNKLAHVGIYDNELKILDTYFYFGRCKNYKDFTDKYNYTEFELDRNIFNISSDYITYLTYDDYILMKSKIITFYPEYAAELEILSKPFRKQKLKELLEEL